MFRTLQQNRGMICGVCTRIANRADLPVVVIRVLAVGLLLVHALGATILYLCAAAWMRGGDRGFAQGLRQAPAAPYAGSGAPPAEPPSWDRNGLTDRFSSLEQRLAQMEGASLDREAGLRRAFHDLERS